MWKFQSPNDLQTILKNLKNDTIDRFPISLDVLSVLSDMSAKDIEFELIRLGGKVTSYGDVKFLETIDLTASISEFVPQAVRTRDDVLGLLNYTRDHAEKVYASKTCNHVTACDNAKCTDNHYKPDMRSNTNVSLGFCSYLNLCKNLNCKYLHFKSSSLESASPIPPFSQYIKADIRRLDLSVFHSLVGAVVIDPPWDIHMELSYGTMTDSEMRSLNVGSIHDEGFIFVWATVRTLDVARDCIRTWGYEYVDDVVWVKTNQIGGTVRSGRTGHWFNHNKEHCLIGMKGDVNWSSFGYYRRDCDVIVAPVREASRKPDELYSLVERMVSDSGKYCLELFGRTHNLRNGWITVGNQLDGDFVTDQVLADRLARVVDR